MSPDASRYLRVDVGASPVNSKARMCCSSASTSASDFSVIQWSGRGRGSAEMTNTNRAAFGEYNSDRGDLEQDHEIGSLREAVGDLSEFDEVIALDPSDILTKFIRRDALDLLRVRRRVRLLGE